MIRAGVIGVLDGQRTQQSIAVLERIGVPEIGYGDLREVGRGIRENSPSAAQLCGNCGDRKVAISPTGDVWPCVFSRWLPAGNVRETPRGYPHAQDVRADHRRTASGVRGMHG
ncbi:hypothetical protein Mro03_23070 [Microbispora rosea subsp. rosea]|nr:hypothetical protein Mro03_23070 [Microbispora rosea subsp. rosea]